MERGRDQTGKFNHITEILQKPKAVFRNSRENVGAINNRPWKKGYR
ncbi:MAG: hypothetical protein HFJ19_01130 [Clostridia bacterium]|nr:hypothetical protein [Clostridia bacterium]